MQLQLFDISSIPARKVAAIEDAAPENKHPDLSDVQQEALVDIWCNCLWCNEGFSFLRAKFVNSGTLTVADWQELYRREFIQFADKVATITPLGIEYLVERGLMV